MMTSGVFLLDANVFIEAARRYYAFDIVPSFWPKLVMAAETGRVITIDRVREEIVKNNDDLAQWLVDDFSTWIASSSTPEVVQAYGVIMQWVYDAKRSFISNAKSEFASGADGWLIAYALVQSCCLVTHEAYKPDIQRKVPIPNVCRAFGIPYVDTFALMRELSVVL